MATRTTGGSGKRKPPAAGAAPRRRRARKAPAAGTADQGGPARAARDRDDVEVAGEGEGEGEEEGEGREPDELDGEGDGDGDDSMVAEVVDEGELAGDRDALEPENVDAELERLSGGRRGRRDAGEDGASEDRHRLVRHDPLTAYIQETRRYPLLERDAEHELAVRLVEEGDTAAARTLIEANLRLVVKIAYEYRRAHRNLLDLIQEGNIGLMQAVRKYDPYRGVKLSSYAAWWIRAYILKFILNNWRLVKIGTTQAQRKLFFNLRKEKERLEQLGFQPEPALLADRLDVRERDVIEMETRMGSPEASLDAPMAGLDGEGARTRHDLVADQDQARPDVRVEEGEFTALLRQKLEAFAGTLKGREETIFRERWLTDSPLTLQQIGDRYGVSRERARQLEKRMLTRLRKYLEQEFGTAVDIDALSRE
ncbi:MAG TPA: RNA polymerase factor sigma-32 [Kofleriaceae bacterium]|nr:RNA polymerase factor sigma-32 [Kofleriaceae bacterium]